MCVYGNGEEKKINKWQLKDEIGDGNSLVVRWLGLGALTAKGPASIPGQRTKIPQAARHSQKKVLENNFLVLAYESCRQATVKG